MDELMLKVEHVSKEYRLGTIGGGTLKAELQSKLAKLRHKEDPNLKIGEVAHEKNERFIALDDVSLEIKKGEKVAIIGHNGAGKSTLLKLICRVTAPTSGNIYMNGRITSMLEVGTGFHNELTGRENIYLNGAILGMTKAEVDRKIDKIIEFSEIGNFIDTPIKRYSSGMKVKLGFAVASHLESEIMIMDEVLAVGDLNFQRKCLDRMKQLAETENRTIIYVSHAMRTVRNLCDRCIVLEKGKKVYDGEVEKAIDLYAGKQFDTPAKLFTDNIERTQKTIDGVRFDSIEVHNHSGWKINYGSCLDFSITVKASCDLNSVGFRSRITTSDDQSVTVLLAPKLFNCKKGDVLTIPLRADVSQLVPGSYYLTPVLYSVDESGEWVFYDHLSSAICIDILKTEGFNENMKWENRYWGNVKFPEIIDLRGVDNV